MVEAVSSDVRELRVPQKGLVQQMSPFGQLQPCVNFRIWWLFSCDLRQDANFTLLQPFSCCKWRPCVISPSAGATLGQRPPSSRIQNARLRPLSSGDLPTASRLQVKASSSVWEQLDPDLVLFGLTRSQHTRVACLPQGTQPRDIGVPDPLPRALTLLARAGLCSPGTLASLAQSPAPQGYPADASRRLASF